MASGDSPAVARRRVRLALRHARESRGLTQTQVAEEMEWSLSKVMRVESGEVTIAPNDLKVLAPYLGITDKATIDAMLADVRASRERRKMWWDEPPFRDSLTAAMRMLFRYEAEATAIRYFTSVLIPGHLQTPAYGEAVLNKFRRDLSETQMADRLEARTRRSLTVSGKRTSQKLYALLDEAALYRQVGGAKVLADQIRNIVALVTQKRLLARVLPFAVDGPLPAAGDYELISLDGRDEESAVLYYEGGLDDAIIEDPQRVSEQREVFEQLWAAALDDRSSVELMQHSVSVLEATDSKTG